MLTTKTFIPTDVDAIAYDTAISKKLHLV